MRETEGGQKVSDRATSCFFFPFPGAACSRHSEDANILTRDVILGKVPAIGMMAMA